MKVEFLFKWYDFWIGVFYDRKNNWLYFLPFPMIGIIIKLPIKRDSLCTCQSPETGHKAMDCPIHNYITVGNDQIKELEVEGKCPTCEAETVIHVRSVGKDQNNDNVYLDLLKCSNCGHEWSD